ncbi:MAG: EpsG family protein [Blastomonas sp.]
MLIYWLMLIFPGVVAVLSRRGEHGANRAARRDVGTFAALIAFWLFYNAISVFRYDTGGDWYTYDILIQEISISDYAYALSRGDDGFMTIAYVSTRLGLDLYGVNLVCSALLSAGVVSLARRLPDPWVAIAASVPYILIVVGLGYIRQGAAIGLILLAINAIVDRRNIGGVVYMLLAMLFHFGAIVVVPFIGLALVRRNPVAMIGIGFIGLLIYAYVFTSDRLYVLDAGYLDIERESSGAGIRLVMNLLPSLLFLWRRDKLKLEPLERGIWSNFAWFSIVLMVALYATPSSTAVDRVALFFSPIQVFVFGYFLTLLGIRGRGAALVIVGLLTYCALVFAVWAFFADHSQFWVPYKSVFTSGY